jgi:ABC-2 type transport system permease protein
MAGSAPAWTVRRLFALWRFYGTMDLKWMMRDARSLVMWALADILTAVSVVASTLLLAARFNGIGRWSTPQLSFMLGYALLVGTIPNIFFNYNVAYISRRIGRGQFDHVLVQPQPLWMILLTEGFSPFSTMLALLPALVLLAWSLGRGVHAVTVGWLAAFGLNVAASAAIALSFTLIVGSLAYWAPRAAEEINMSSWHLLESLKSFPLDGVGAGLTVTMLTVVPSGFLAWYPSRALLGIDRAGYAILVTPLAAVVSGLLAVWVFRRGLRQYGRTGSQRYLSFGHRR